MDATLIEELERYRFSPARRIFVVGEMLLRVKDLGLEDLAEQMGRLLAAEREGLHREVKRRSALWPREGSLSGEGVMREEGHLQWLMLIVEIQRQGEGAQRRWILEPVYQQLRRLKDYSQRSRRRSMVERSVLMVEGGEVLWADGAE